MLKDFFDKRSSLKEPPKPLYVNVSGDELICKETFWRNICQSNLLETATLNGYENMFLNSLALSMLVWSMRMIYKSLNVNAKSAIERYQLR